MKVRLREVSLGSGAVDRVCAFDGFCESEINSERMSHTLIGGDTGIAQRRCAQPSRWGREQEDPWASACSAYTHVGCDRLCGA